MPACSTPRCCCRSAEPRTGARRCWTTGASISASSARRPRPRRRKTRCIASATWAPPMAGRINLRPSPRSRCAFNAPGAGRRAAGRMAGAGTSFRQQRSAWATLAPMRPSAGRCALAGGCRATLGCRSLIQRGHPAWAGRAPKTLAGASSPSPAGKGARWLTTRFWMGTSGGPVIMCPNSRS